MKIDEFKQIIDDFIKVEMSAKEWYYPDYTQTDISDLFHEEDAATWKQWTYLHEVVIPTLNTWSKKDYMVAGGMFRRLFLGRPIWEGDVDLFHKVTDWYSEPEDFNPEATLRDAGFELCLDGTNMHTKNGQKFQILWGKSYGRWPSLPAWLEEEIMDYTTNDRLQVNEIMRTFWHLESLFDTFDTTVSCCGAHLTDLPRKMGDPFPVVVHKKFAEHLRDKKLVTNITDRRAKLLLTRKRFVKLINEGFMPADSASEKMWADFLKLGHKAFFKNERYGYDNMQRERRARIRPLMLNNNIAWDVQLADDQMFRGAIDNDN